MNMIMWVNLFFFSLLAGVLATEDRNLEECGGATNSTKTSISDFEDGDIRTLIEKVLTSHVAITFNNTRDIVLRCSGVLITRRHVLTAANCFDRWDNRIYQAHIGSTDFQRGTIYSIMTMKVHSGYRPDTHLYNDVALLTLTEDVEDPKVNVVCLPNNKVAEKNLTGLGATAAGWGLKTDSSSSHFFVSNMRMTSNKTCHRFYKKMESHGTAPGLLCAYNKDRGKEACGGEAGSPLMFLQEGKWYVVGFELFGGDCLADWPIAYAQVSVYLNWIRRNIQDNSNSTVEAPNSTEISPNPEENASNSKEDSSISIDASNPNKDSSKHLVQPIETESKQVHFYYFHVQDVKCINCSVHM